MANRFLSTGQLYGDVQVWKTPSNPPTDYVNSGYCQLLQSPGYDNVGNLFVLGYVDAVGDTLCVLPAHGKALEGSVILNGQIYDAEGVMWDGKYITLSDSNPYDRTNSGVTAIYRAVPKKGVDNVLSLLIVGSTILTDTCFHGQDDTVVQQAFIVGNKNTPANDEEGKVVIGGNIVCYSRFDFWKYPQGGNPSSSLAQPPIRPQGQSVSIAE